MDIEIEEITKERYASFFHPQYIYNSVDFAELNSEKADVIHYLKLGDSKPRLGIILGEKGNMLRSPFSAPFGGFTTNGVQRIEYMDEAVKLVCQYARSKGKELLITPPSVVYDESQMSKWISAFSRQMKTKSIDLNYHFDLSRMDSYTDFMERSARKNLNRSLKENLVFSKLDSSDRKDVARAYDVIRRNREERGFPLRMTLEQVWRTVSEVVHADFFVLEYDGTDIAAAQVFYVADGIAQVVYWGDIREYSSLRPMNNLTYNVFKYYHDKGLRLLDIGISTENGVPNYGLCEFKESIGCSVTLKYVFNA